MIRFKDYIKEYRIVMPSSRDGLGISFLDMPQVETKFYKDYIKYLSKHGVHFDHLRINPNKLKPIQKDFSKDGVEASLDKIAKEIESGGNAKEIIISRDNYIIDGHHRWIAYKNISMDINVMRSNIKMDKLLRLTNEYPHVVYKEVGTNKALKK